MTSDALETLSLLTLKGTIYNGDILLDDANGINNIHELVSGGLITVVPANYISPASIYFWLTPLGEAYLRLGVS